ASFTPISGGVCAPKGFRAHGVKCGIKDPNSAKLDLALIYSEKPCVSSGLFTRNQIKAAPVKLSQAHLEAEIPKHGILANSGNANAAAGPDALDRALRLAEIAAGELGIEAPQLLVASTGIIGKPMPMDRIEPQIPAAVAGLNDDGSDQAAEAIMTSDTRPKQVALEVQIDGKPVRIGGIAKGAGMIRPDMATMLAFITTDADISQEALDSATRDGNGESFNRITVDGDMSTNDTVFVLANGEAGNSRIESGSAAAEEFGAALREVMLKLAKMLVSDGERVTKFVTITVSGAKTDACAKAAAEAVGNSNLVKSSWNGNDPNWGRVIHALGYSGAEIVEEKTDIGFGGLSAAINGVTAETPIEDLVAVVSEPEFTIEINLNLGDSSYVVYASDLSPEYVDFNRQEYAAMRAKMLEEG
ncbi:MAG: bifunctional glutamate N-acetyltransferase/amino-acid acetyltransferase ArgJ, partial [Verrucomicrobiota bacterium]